MLTDTDFQKEIKTTSVQSKMDRLTAVIEEYKNKDWGTDLDVGHHVWPHLKNVYEHSNNIPGFKDWKYYKEYATAERCHADGLQTFPLLSWQNSFALTLLFNIYH